VGGGPASDGPLERFGPFVAGLTDGPVVVEHPGRARPRGRPRELRHVPPGDRTGLSLNPSQIVDAGDESAA